MLLGNEESGVQINISKTGGVKISLRTTPASSGHSNTIEGAVLKLVDNLGAWASRQEKYGCRDFYYTRSMAVKNVVDLITEESLI